MAAVATFCSLVLLPHLCHVGAASSKARPVKNGELSLGYANATLSVAPASSLGR